MSEIEKQKAGMSDAEKIAQLEAMLAKAEAEKVEFEALANKRRIEEEHKANMKADQHYGSALNAIAIRRINPMDYASPREVLDYREIQALKKNEKGDIKRACVSDSEIRKYRGLKDQGFTEITIDMLK